MGNDSRVLGSSMQDQQVFGKMDVQPQYVTFQTGRSGRRTKTCIQDVYVPSPTSIRNFSEADLDKKTISLDGKIVSYKEYRKQFGGEFYKDGKGNSIYVPDEGEKLVLNTKNEWMQMNEFYGDKAQEVNANIKHAQKASFIKDYGLTSRPDGKYQAKDSSKDTRTYDFDLTGKNLKVRLSDGLVEVDGKVVESKKPFIYENGEWKIDENSGPVLREDLNAETKARKAGDEALTTGLADEAKTREAGDKEKAKTDAQQDKKISDLTAENKSLKEKLIELERKLKEIEDNKNKNSD